MSCDAFEWLLDERGAGALPAEARAHAAGCARCARALAAATALERALAAHFAPGDAAPPAGFAERVLARIAALERAARVTGGDDLPGWVRAAGEPATALAAIVAALMLWQGPALTRGARALAAAAGPLADGLRQAGELPGLAALGRAFALPGAPAWVGGVAAVAALAPPLALVALALWRASERVVARPFPAFPPGARA